MNARAIVSDWVGSQAAEREAARHRRTLICTASDARFFPLFEELLASLDAAALPDAWTLGVLDLGLNAAQRELLLARGAIVRTPGWHLPIAMPEATPPWFCGFAARPYLPQIFAGFEVYVHIDADACVLRGDALLDYAEAAMGSEYAVVFEQFGPGVVVPFKQADGTIGYGLLNETSVRAAVESCYIGNFGSEYAWCAREFICNNGVWAMRGDVPHWDTWARYLARALAQGPIHKLSEQQSMCLALLEGAVPVRRMPNTHNWNIAAQLPMGALRDGRTTIVAPDSGAEVGVLHLTDLKQLRFYDVPMQGGGSLRLPLRFRELRQALPVA